VSTVTDLVVIRWFDAPRELVEATFPEIAATETPAADDMRLRLEFHDEEGGRTRLVLTQGPCPADLEAGAREAWSAAFVRLDKLLSRRTGSATR
jgi:hypothetical protein